MIITIAQKQDFNAINHIVKEGQDEHSEALPNIFNKVEKVMPELYFNELLEDTNSDVLIAKIKDEVVGFAVMERKESPPFDSMAPRVYAYMHDFGVKSSFHRQGIGKMLFEACVEWSKNMGASSMELNVWEFNQKAISFYESFQMKTVSRKMTLNF